MFIRKKSHIFLVLSLCLLLMGCSSQTTPTPTPTPTPVEDKMAKPDTTPSPQSTPTPTADDPAKKIADALVKDLADVEDATVVISGEMAYAGIKIRDTADAAKAEDIKKEVIAKIKEVDPAIKDAMVSENADTFTRVKEIGQDVLNGKPISGFVTEMDNLFTRVVPSK